MRVLPAGRTSSSELPFALFYPRKAQQEYDQATLQFLGLRVRRTKPLVRPVDARRWRAAFPPVVHHHLALFFARAARAGGAASAVEHHVRSLASWIALADERRYLRALAEGIDGGALSANEVARAAGDERMVSITDAGEAWLRQLDAPRGRSEPPRAGPAPNGEVGP